MGVGVTAELYDHFLKIIRGHLVPGTRVHKLWREDLARELSEYVAVTLPLVGPQGIGGPEKPDAEGAD